MNNEERLIKIIIKNYFDSNCYDDRDIVLIIDIIQQYPHLCYELLTKGTLYKKNRVPLLNSCLNDKKVFYELCNSKTYINHISLEEENIILNNCDRSQIFTIVNIRKSIHKHLNKLDLNDEVKELVESAILMNKLSKL